MMVSFYNMISYHTSQTHADPKSAEKIAKLHQHHRGNTIYRPPVVFNSYGTKYFLTPIEKILSIEPV